MPCGRPLPILFDDLVYVGRRIPLARLSPDQQREQRAASSAECRWPEALKLSDPRPVVGIQRMQMRHYSPWLGLREQGVAVIEAGQVVEATHLPSSALMARQPPRSIEVVQLAQQVVSLPSCTLCGAARAWHATHQIDAGGAVAPRGQETEYTQQIELLHPGQQRGTACLLDVAEADHRAFSHAPHAVRTNRNPNRVIDIPLYHLRTNFRSAVA